MYYVQNTKKTDALLWVSLLSNRSYVQTDTLGALMPRKRECWSHEDADVL